MYRHQFVVLCNPLSPNVLGLSSRSNIVTFSTQLYPYVDDYKTLLTLFHKLVFRKLVHNGLLVFELTTHEIY